MEASPRHCMSTGHVPGHMTYANSNFPGTSINLARFEICIKVQHMCTGIANRSKSGDATSADWILFGASASGCPCRCVSYRYFNTT